MKIAILGDALDLQYAGIHYYLRELLQHLLVLDEQNEYLIIRPEKKNDFSHFTNVRQLVVPVKNGLHQRFRLFTEIPLLVRKEQPDLVFEPAHFGPFLLPSKIKRVTMIHDLTPILFPAYHTKSSHYSHRALLPSVLKSAHHLLTNSNFSKQDLIRLFPFTKDKITAIPLGKDPIFHPNKSDENTQKVLKKYKIDSPYLLFIGTLEVRKNLGVLLEAFEALKQNNAYANIKLVLGGKRGWKNDGFFSNINRSPFKKDIIELGYIERADLPILYREAKLFVYPSKYEGFGLPVLEAMACGTPVLSSNISSLPEVGGDAIAYFNPNSADELLSKIKELLLSKAVYNKMHIASLERAKLFSWERTARETLGVFEAIGL